MSNAAGGIAPPQPSAGAPVPSAADVGGPDTYARSPRGQRLRQDGHGAPVVVHRRRAGRLATQLALGMGDGC
jgi:hypothetical protein